ncbi:ATP-dependent Clp protease adaptor ClpS [Sulfurovum sp. bin170]|uniref:ATP-dependent Clp protease adaptor ClpS n=1 Tax=Sulfurovum sp. bin170 TaxID=2695268 RepID=UPI0013DFA8EA|nr:ATP-dependent Clp protease adaptor ClpS [Sulfurovum sp. bin170]NEW59891.1 ATP-dependent Clp protease adaptor ClpS [Sulfurovum sp. bin170]
MPRIEEELDSSLALYEPTKYKVLLHNDDYTTMDFVVEILMGLFHKNIAESERIMFAIHNSGKGICGVYTHEIAKTKAYQVKQLAKKSGFPLLATVEEE